MEIIACSTEPLDGTAPAHLYVVNSDNDNGNVETGTALRPANGSMATTNTANITTTSISPRLHLSSEDVLTVAAGSVLTIAPAADAGGEGDNLVWQTTDAERLCLANHSGDLCIGKQASVFLHADLVVHGSLVIEGELSAQNDADVFVSGDLTLKSRGVADLQGGGRVRIGGNVRIATDGIMKVRHASSLILEQRRAGVFVNDAGVVRRGSNMSRREKLTITTARHMRMLRQWTTDSLEQRQDAWTMTRRRAASDVPSSTLAGRSVLRGPPTSQVSFSAHRSNEVLAPSQLRARTRSEAAEQTRLASTAATVLLPSPSRIPMIRTLAPPSYWDSVRASPANSSAFQTPDQPPPYTER